MKFSLNWISDYINLDLTAEEIAEQLTQIGLLVESITPRGGDFLLEIEINSNRPDCMNMLGICRELAAATGSKRHSPAFDYSEIEESTADLATIEIQDAELCPRYCAKLIKNVKVGLSPDWLKERLASIGLHSINNIVDITNFVLWEMGHPLHAFDFNSISGSKIIVRRARKGEKIITIDGVIRELDESIVVIADTQKPIAIAGVMGGVNSYITEQTKDVLLESAYFDPVSIRKTAKKFGLDTDASHRFERGCDPEALQPSIDRSCHLLQEISGAKACKEIIDLYPKKVPPKKALLRIKRAEKLLGIKLNNEQIENTLEQLEFTAKKLDEQQYEVSIPTFRVDVTQEIDLIEEVARFYGYHNIPSSLPPLKEMEIKDTKDIKIKSLIRSLLCSVGYSEAINYSFVDEENNILFDENNDRDFIRLKNPIADNMDIMRTSLLPGLIENVVKNINYGTINVRLFEIGKCFFPISQDSLPLERESLAIIACGYRRERYWKGKHDEIDFFDLKGVIELIFQRLNWKDIKFKNQEIKYLHPGQSAGIIVEGEKIGSIGLLHPEISQKYDLNESVYVAHLIIDKLLERKLEKEKYQIPPKFPGIRRDISFIVDETLPFSKIKDLIDSLSEEIIFDVKIIDKYEGANLPEEKTGLSISIYYQHFNRTLKAEEVSQVHNKIINLLKSNFKATLR